MGYTRGVQIFLKHIDIVCCVYTTWYLSTNVCMKDIKYGTRREKINAEPN